MTMPPPVVCLTCPAASPATRKFGAQHLPIGPETRTEPDFVVSITAFGQRQETLRWLSQRPLAKSGNRNNKVRLSPSLRADRKVLGPKLSRRWRRGGTGQTNDRWGHRHWRILWTVSRQSSGFIRDLKGRAGTWFPSGVRPEMERAIRSGPAWNESRPKSVCKSI